MELLRHSGRRPRNLAILPGAFHPVTRAHIALAEAALSHTDEVLFVMPRRFPHKDYDEVALADRAGILRAAIETHPHFSLAISEGGLFAEIARECREHWREECRLWILCGRDAAERALTWTYPEGMTVESMLAEFGLLVADRLGRFDPPAEHAERVVRVDTPPSWDELSATEIRRRIRCGEPWRHLVPEGAAERIARVYLGL